MHYKLQIKTIHLYKNSRFICQLIYIIAQQIKDNKIANQILNIQKQYYQNYRMSYYSPALQHHLANRKPKDQTKTIIKDMQKDVPILSTIVDYGGQSTIDDILHIQEQDQNFVYKNNFQKILEQSYERSQHTRSKKYLSFIDYKAQPSKIRDSKAKFNNTKKLKASIPIQMPQQLKQLKNQILVLPSIGQSRITSRSKLNSVGSRLLLDLKKSSSRRYQTEASVSQNRSTDHKQKYMNSLQNIFTQFQSPEINCNNHFLSMQKQCKKILLEQQGLLKQYKRFQSLGSPPKRIIQLKSLLNKFQHTMNKNLGSQVSQKASNMDLKRYDIVLKHEEQARKLTMAKFQQKQRQQRIEQNREVLNSGTSSDALGFKLNSQGKLIYLNKNKTPK